MICPCCGSEFDALFEYVDRCPRCGEEIVRCPYCECEMDGDGEYHECPIP